MKINFTLFLVFFLSCVASAQWSNNASVANNLVASAASSLSTISDSAGGAFVLYFKDENLYLQHLNANGIKQFATPVQVSQQYGDNDFQYDIMNDGSGNAIIAYYDLDETGIYVQKIGANGTKLWNATGVLISDKNDADFPYLTSDGNGGAYIAWQESDTVDYIKAQRISSTGTLAWANGGVRIANQYHDYVGDITYDGQGGLFVIFTSLDIYNADEFIQGQHINNAGTLLWGNTAKLLVSKDSEPYIGYLEGGSTPDWAIADGAGGVYFIYNTYPETYITAQRIDNNGNLLWGSNGVKASTEDIANWIDESIIRDAQGGINVYWSQDASDNLSAGIYGQRVSATGTVSWNPAGLSFVNNDIYQTYLSLVNDRDGNVIFTWNNDVALYAVKVNSITGATLWNANGNPVCTVANSYPEDADITYSYPTGAIIGWNDYRNGNFSQSSVYAERITDNGVLPVHLLSFNALLQNKTVNLAWNTTQEINTSAFIVERSKDGIHYSDVQKITAKGSSGTNSYAVADNAPFTGNSFYRLKIVDKDGSFAYSNSVPVNYFIKNIISISPNPAKNNLFLQLQSLRATKATIQISDVNGTTVYMKQIAVREGVNTLPIQISSFAKGAYFLKVLQDKDVQIVRWVKE